MIVRCLLKLLIIVSLKAGDQHLGLSLVGGLGVHTVAKRNTFTQYNDKTVLFLNSFTKLYALSIFLDKVSDNQVRVIY